MHSASSTRNAPLVLAGAPALARILPFAAFIALLALEPLLAAVADPRWIAIARGLVAAALLAYFWPRYIELRDGSPLRLMHAVVAAAAGGAIFLAWIAFDSGWMVIGGPAKGFIATDPLMLWLRLFGFVLVVPVMEELFWRSFLMRWIGRKDFLALDPRAVGFAAFAISSALFAVEHAQWFAGLIAGLAYGWLYMRSRNLWIPIISHATTNALLAGWIFATASWHLW